MIFKLKVNVPDGLTDDDSYYYLIRALRLATEDIELLEEWPPAADTKHKASIHHPGGYKWSLTGIRIPMERLSVHGN